jgi:Asp-tRNA(Asn)/Glu-tRNA(Gln) amidotransferase A subunit family amidase
MGILENIFENVDLIANPGTANSAPKILSNEDQFGSVKILETLKAALYTKMGNLAGQPSIVLRTGYDSMNLPTSVMFQSKWVYLHKIE